MRESGVKLDALLVGMLHAPGRAPTACGTAKLSRPGSRSCRRASAHWPCSQAAAASASAPGASRRSTTYLQRLGGESKGWLEWMGTLKRPFPNQELMLKLEAVTRADVQRARHRAPTLSLPPDGKKHSWAEGA